MMEYIGYMATVTFDNDAEIFHGEVINLKDVVTFQGATVEELKEAFHESVDDYLEFCSERGEQPEKSFSGKFMVRLDAELHRKAYEKSKSEGKSLNNWIKEELQRAIQ
jgi:predicted HicB family RNase H-like nuclease